MSRSTSRKPTRQEIADQTARPPLRPTPTDEDDTIAFDRMTEEDLLAGIEGLVPPEKSDDY